MYKVFFKDRTVYFGDDFSKIFERNSGLFYKYNNIHELTELVHAFYFLKKIDKLFIFHDDILTLFDEFKACFKYVEAGGGVVFNGKGEFLVIKRNNIWDLPKGKLEKNENFESAALREVEEETGLDSMKIKQPILSTYHTYQEANKMILKKTKWYEMRYSGDKDPVPEERENITDTRWVAPGNIDFIRKNTFPSILDVLYLRDLL